MATPGNRRGATTVWIAFFLACATVVDGVEKPVADFSVTPPVPLVRSAWSLVTQHAAGGKARTSGAGSAAVVFHPERLIVRFRPSVTLAQRGALHQAAGCRKVLRRYSAVNGLCVVEVPAQARSAALATYRADARVLYVEPDYELRLHAIPSDTLFDSLWGLQNTGQVILGAAGRPGADIRATQAWNLWTGDRNVRIAVIDSGIDYNHPDLAANVWTNPGEIPGNGIDDDGNGWIDDVHGYDTRNDDGDPLDDFGHGSHVSGILGAVGHNGLGVTGVTWKCQIVAIKAFGADGTAFLSDLLEAMQYVIDNRIRLSNDSWGGDQFSQALFDMIGQSQSVGHLFVTAAGNGFGRNIDDFPVYPAAFDLPNIVSVAAMANNDRLSFASNVGPNNVDLAAPGQDILSTVPGGGYAYATGTSMATAYVSGVAALLMSRRPSLTADQVRSRLLNTTRSVDGLEGRLATGGVVSAVAAVGDCNENGVADEAEIASGASFDCNSNGIPDECETDCNGNGKDDFCDLVDAVSKDCNGNTIPDECDLTGGVSHDCNGNATPDECDVTSGQSEDQNQSGVPDECETCTVDADCNDGNVCTDDVCQGGLCFYGDNVAVCDDGDDCTTGDRCMVGQCVGSPVSSLACSPLFTVKATSVNGVPIPGGRTDDITADRGDRLTVDFFVEQWSPQTVQGYNILIDPASYTSGLTGRLEPLVDPTPSAGAFVDRSRSDFIFLDRTALTLVLNQDLTFYEYISVLIFLDECAPDPGQPAYLGSLIVDVSDTASGTFSLCLVEDFQNATFLIDCPLPVVVSPASTHCLTIHVPVSECQKGPDCNGNGSWDVCDIANGISEDCNRDDIPDDCELAAGTSQDCNGNAVPDECDVAAGTSVDCNDNLVPDECEADCNTNGIADGCDINDGTSPDCNGNTVPDECDISTGTSEDCDAGRNGNGVPDDCERDCNSNGVADSCDLVRQTSVDADDNTVPDECQVVRAVPASFSTIQSAINAANPGDVVLVSDGTYQGPGNSDLDFLGKILTLRSEHGPASCIIDGSGAGNGIFFRRGEGSGSRVEGFTITHAAIGVKVENFSDPLIRDCILTNHFGSAINLFRSSPVFHHCTIRDNPASLTSWSVLSSPTYSNCRFLNNQNGAVFLFGGKPKLLNCLIAGNRSTAGGAIWSDTSKPLIRNCTIVGNTADIGGAIFAQRSDLTLRNSILFQNVSLAVASNVFVPDRETIFLVDSALTVAFSDVGGGSAQALFVDPTSHLTWDVGNIHADPGFVASPPAGGFATGDIHLRDSSPCINAGDPAFPAVTAETDLDGEPRIMLAAVDMGADEAVAFADCNKNGLPDGRDLVYETSRDCNHNLLPDECDINGGVSVDTDHNGIPDECEHPFSVVPLSRQLYVAVASGAGEMAIRITGDAADPAVACVSLYVQPDGSLDSVPVYQTAAEWGRICVSGPEILSETVYSLQSVIAGVDDVALPPAVMVATGVWGDVDRDGVVTRGDVSLLVRVFEGDVARGPLEDMNVVPCQPDGVVDASDIQRVIAALLGRGGSRGPCPSPCP